jgi:hypothetical protein
VKKRDELEIRKSEPSSEVHQQRSAKASREGLSSLGLDNIGMPQEVQRGTIEKADAYRIAC